MRKSTWLRIAAIALLAAAVGAVLLLLPPKKYVPEFFAFVERAGPWGPLVVGASYIPASLLFVPGFLLTLLAGFAFGLVEGTVAVSLGSTLGAAAAFVTGRTLARGLIEEKVSRNPRFRAIDRAVEQQGFKIVLLTRLSPIFPFNLLNYAFGLTKVSLKDYVLASWIGMLPGTVMYVYFGSTIKSLARLAAGEVETGAVGQAMFYGGLLATVIVTFFVTRVARREMRKSMSLPETHQAQASQGESDA